MELLASAGLIPASAGSLPRLGLYQPRSISEAVALLEEAPAPTVLAGGTDLVACFNEGLKPSSLIDLSKLAELRSIDADDRSLRLGAMVTHGAGCKHTAVVQRAPGFAAAWARIANPRIRCRATLGGNLMARRARYEASLLLQALGAQVRLVTRQGSHEVPPGALWTPDVPSHALLHSVVVETGSLLVFRYERSLRPLLTFASCVRAHPQGLMLTCAVASEYLRPVRIDLQLPGLQIAHLAGRAKAIARDVFEQLPETFADAVLSHAYARSAGAVLLARQLAGVDHA